MHASTWSLRTSSYAVAHSVSCDDRGTVNEGGVNCPRLMLHRLPMTAHEDVHNKAPWGWPSRGGAVLDILSPQLGEDPPCWGPGVMWSSGRTGVAQLVARSTPDWCVVGSSPTCGTEHFSFPPSAPRLGNQRPWYVQPRLCDWAYKRSRATYCIF